MSRIRTELAAAGGRRLDDDLLELGQLIEPAQQVDRELERLVVGLRRGAGLPGRHLRILLVQGLATSSGHQAEARIFCGSSQIRML